MTAVALAVASALAAYSPADIPNVHKANRTRYVSNPDGVLSRQAEERLDSLLGAVWQATSAEVVVVAVDSIEGRHRLIRHRALLALGDRKERQ